MAGNGYIPYPITPPATVQYERTDMTAQSMGRESAKIYLFPVSARVARSRFEQEIARLADRDARYSPPIQSENGWYHDDAMSAERKPT